MVKASEHINSRRPALEAELADLAVLEELSLQFDDLEVSTGKGAKLTAPSVNQFVNEVYCGAETIELPNSPLVAQPYFLGEAEKPVFTPKQYELTGPGNGNNKYPRRDAWEEEMKADGIPTEIIDHVKAYIQELETSGFLE